MTSRLLHTMLRMVQRISVAMVAALLVGLLMASGALAQREDVAAAQAAPSLHITVRPDDRTAATLGASDARYHLLLAKTEAAQGASRDGPAIEWPAPSSVQPTMPGPELALPFAVPSPPAPAFYPEDVAKLAANGATVMTAQSHGIFVNCASGGASCWGDPLGFLNDLGQSTFVHLVDQYVGTTTNNRYTVGTSFTVSGPIFAGTSGVPTLSENDILAIVHAAASTVGGGYSHIYHVFLPQGVDTCMDEGGCYSPTSAATFLFCAYHFAVNFSDIGRVYYTVEPFQQVQGCAVPASPPSPNGQLADSTNSTLSHEVFETITDPDITTGFRAVFSLPVLFNEIADLCQGPFAIVPLNGKNYELQLEYSNTYHACASTP